MKQFEAILFDMNFQKWDKKRQQTWQMPRSLSSKLCLSLKKVHHNVFSEQNPTKAKYVYTYMFAKKNKIIYSKRRLDTRIYCQSAKGSSKRCFGRPFAAKARIESNTFQPPKTQIYLWIFTQILSLGWCVRKSKFRWYYKCLQGITGSLQDFPVVDKSCNIYRLRGNPMIIFLHKISEFFACEQKILFLNDWNT